MPYPSLFSNSYLLVGAIATMLSSIVAAKQGDYLVINGQNLQLLPQHQFQLKGTEAATATSNVQIIMQQHHYRIIQQAVQADLQPLAATSSIDATNNCGHCEVLYNHNNNRYYQIKPYFMLVLQANTNLAQLRERLQQMHNLQIINLNRFIANVKVTHQSAWLQVYRQLQTLQATDDSVQLIRADVTSRVFQAR